MLNIKKNKIIKLLPIIFFTVIVFFFGYYADKITQSMARNTKNTDAIISRVFEMYLIPGEETPTVATVTDPEVLKEKLFFTSSLKGDKVLIFTNLGKAILYRPSIDKIIETISVKSN